MKTDREKLLELLDHATEAFRFDAWENTDKIADYLIEHDVTIPVRCKDCKYSGMYRFGCEEAERLACLEMEEDGFIRMACAVTPDYYCGNGERKEK